MSRIRIALVFGTRPEAVKLLPVILLLRADERFDVRVIVTGQHRTMLEEILTPFGVVPDVDLAIMQPAQSLNDIAARVIPRLDELFATLAPRLVLVQGDTTGAFCAALVAFQRRVAVGHVEAGLRSFDRQHPYPEEVNRRMIGALADVHFAPTRRAADCLAAEGAPADSVFVTGNTGVDALLLALRRADDGAAPAFGAGGGGRRLVLVTLHRREAWDGVNAAGENVLAGILDGIRRSAVHHPDVDFVYPVHLNPRVRGQAEQVMAGVANVHLVAPVPYLPFVHLMARAAAIVTDSGGIQEEAPSLGVSVLIARKTTERPEALASRTNRLVGTEAADIEREINAVLAQAAPPNPSRALASPRPNPFGDGRASERIRDGVLCFLGLGARPANLEAEEAAPGAA